MVLRRHNHWRFSPLLENLVENMIGVGSLYRAYSHYCFRKTYNEIH